MLLWSYPGLRSVTPSKMRVVVFNVSLRMYGQHSARSQLHPIGLSGCGWSPFVISRPAF